MFTLIPAHFYVQIRGQMAENKMMLPKKTMPIAICISVLQTQHDLEKAH